MAAQHEIQWSNRRECLEEFARTFGEHPPRAPVPAWWDEFEKWYSEGDATAGHSMILRTEAFGYEEAEVVDDLTDPEIPESA